MYEEYPRDPYHGLNPSFVAKVHAKRRVEAARKTKRLVLTTDVQKAAAELAELRERLAQERQNLRRLMLAANETNKSVVDFPGLSRPRAKNATTVGRIVQRFARRFGVSNEDLVGGARNRDLVLIRQAVIYWCARRTNRSLCQIGRQMKRDHTTVLHSIDKYIEKRARMGRTLRGVR